MTDTPARSARTTGGIIRAAAKAGEPDRYLAALLAPAEHRDDSVTLAAFLAEIGRIGLSVSEPALGEIRIQWWRDTLAVAGQGMASGNPIADAFAEVIARHRLPSDAIDGLLDGHVHGLYPAPPQDVAALRQELILREATAFAFAARILGAPEGSMPKAILADAGIAYGLARLGSGLPYALARGRSPLPADWIAEDASDDPAITRQAISHLATQARSCLLSVKEGWADLPAQLKAAVLPLALVEPYLQALQHSGHDAAHDVGEVSPLTRVWKIAVARIRRRL